jgi:hypothetical protein
MWPDRPEKLVGVLRAGVVEPLAIESSTLAILFRSDPGTFRLAAAEADPILRGLPRSIGALALLAEFVQIDEVAHCRLLLRNALAVRNDRTIIGIRPGAIATVHRLPYYSPEIGAP